MIDIAEEYSNGQTEKLICEAIKQRGNREEIVIVSKVSPTHLGYREVKKSSRE